MYDCLGPENIKADLLFHFTTAEATLNIISSNEFRAGSFARTNDLRENQLCNQFRFQRDKAIYNILANYCHTFSFATDIKHQDSSITIRGFNRPRMWAQYCDLNKGCCLIFSKSKLISEFESETKIRNSYRLFHDYVSYKKKLTDFSVLNLSLELLLSDKVNELFFEKHRDWEDENEYRFVVIDSYPEIEDFHKRIITTEEKSFSIDVRKTLEGVIFLKDFAYRDELMYRLKKHNLFDKTDVYVATGKYGDIQAAIYKKIKKC